MPRMHPRVVILSVIAAVIVLVVIPVLLEDQPGAVRSEAGSVTKTFSATEADSEAVYPVLLTEGSDAAQEATRIFDALSGVQGVVSASIDVSTLDLTVKYASQQADNAVIRASLLASGYLKPTAEDAEPAVLDASGKVQRIAVKDEHGFSPSYIRAKAGVPLEIEYGPGTACRVGVKFPELGVEADISKGGLVKLPAMKPGTYTILCSGDATEGAVFVE